MNIDQILAKITYSQMQFEKQGIIANIILIDERLYANLMQNEIYDIQRVDNQPTIFGCKLIAVDPMTGISIAAARR